MPLALGKFDKLVFHASAVETADGAIAFAGASGRGKSTVAAAFFPEVHDGYDRPTSTSGRGVTDRGANSLCGFVENAVMPGSLIVTNDWSGYASLRKRGFDHHAIAECGEPEVAEQFMPMIHLVFSNLKTWLNGIHRGVSAKHLQAYLNEFTFRFNRRFYPFHAFRSLLGIAGGVEAPTYADLYSGAWTHPTCSGCLH